MSRQKTRSKKARKNDLELISNNNLAIQEGPKKKRWSIHDLKKIKPLTNTQQDMFQSWFQGDHVCAHGSAGTGKTFLAFYLALDEYLQQKEHQRIIVVRSVVPTREVGHLPGTLEEKTAVYELPYHNICQELVGRGSTYQDMKDAGIIEFMTTSFVRGLTWDNAIIIVDEFQNMSMHELDSIMTRVGEHSRVILAGDALNQCDIAKGAQSGGRGLLKRVDAMDSFSNIEFGVDDIVRSQFVKDWIISESAIT